MQIDFVTLITLVLSVLLLGYLTLTLLYPEKSDMSSNGWLQFVVYSLVLLATVRPVGIYLARVLEGERTWLDPILRPFERLIYKLCAVSADKEMNWREYAFAVLGFSAATLLLTYAIERLQALLPFNPQGLANVGPDLAWNTAASFTTKHQLAVLLARDHDELSH